jgi:hypothetical protein
MSTFALILAEIGKADEGSKTAFYIAGGALAAWAVLVSLAGIARPEFPGNAVAARLTMTVSAVLVAAAIATAIITSS